MNGGIHPAERVWIEGEPKDPRDVRVGDRIDTVGPRRGRVEKVTRGSGRGTVWLYGASGACIRCLRDQRVQVSVGGKTRFRRAGKIKPGEFLIGLVSGRLCVDPVVAIRTLEEAVPAIYLEIPPVSLISAEGLVTRPS